MARYVTLGPKASFFRDSSYDLSIAPGEVVELNVMQLNSRKIRRALQGGHLVYTEKNKKEAEAPQYTTEELIESFDSLAVLKSPEKRISKNFTIEQLKEIAPSYGIEVDAEDTKATIIKAILEAKNEE